MSEPQIDPAEEAAYEVAISVINYMVRRCDSKEAALSTVMAQVMGTLQAMIQINFPVWMEQLRKASPEHRDVADAQLLAMFNANLERIREASIAAAMQAVEPPPLPPNHH